VAEHRESSAQLAAGLIQGPNLLLLALLAIDQKRTSSGAVPAVPAFVSENLRKAVMSAPGVMAEASRMLDGKMGPETRRLVLEQMAHDLSRNGLTTQVSADGKLMVALTDLSGEQAAGVIKAVQRDVGDLFVEEIEIDLSGRMEGLTINDGVPSFTPGALLDALGLGRTTKTGIQGEKVQLMTLDEKAGIKAIVNEGLNSAKRSHYTNAVAFQKLLFVEKSKLE
jgi:hypothetical protein